MAKQTPNSVRQSLVLATAVLAPLGGIGSRAEAAGYHGLWTTEFQGRDAILRATVLGHSTSTLRVGSGIAYAFTRSPLALAATALDAQEASGGRFSLGLGAGTRGLRRAYGAEFDPPATRLAELVGELRAIWARADWLRDEAPPPIAIAGVNEAMLRVAAHHGDRVVLHPLCIVEDHLAQRVLPGLAAGTARRESGPPGLSAWCIASVAADPQVARDRARKALAFYLSTPGYRAVFDGTEFEVKAGAIREGFAQSPTPDWDALSRLVPDDLLDQVAVTGTPEQARESAARMRERLGAVGIDELVYQTVDAGSSVTDTVDGINLVVDTFAPRSPDRRVST